MNAEPEMIVEASNSELPLRLGRTQDYARVEALLRSSRFDESTICRLLKIEDLSTLGAVKPDDSDLAAAPSPLASLSKLFLMQQALDCEDVERDLDPADLDSLLALDLLRRGAPDSRICGDPRKYYSTVFLYPVADLFIASDRYRSPDGSPPAKLPDAVFPAVFAGTLRFLRVVSKTQVSELLDLCSGSGVAALAVSRHAERAVAYFGSSGLRQQIQSPNQ